MRSHKVPDTYPAGISPVVSNWLVGEAGFWQNCCLPEERSTSAQDRVTIRGELSS